MYHAIFILIKKQLVRSEVIFGIGTKETEEKVIQS